jgi:hypothetical protein
MVVYTGADTRAVLNTDPPPTKMGLLDLEVNTLSKVHALRSTATATPTHVRAAWAERGVGGGRRSCLR